MGADGLDGVWLDTPTEGRVLHGDLVVDLLEVTQAGAFRRERVVVGAATVERGAVHVPFRSIRASRGRRYRLDIRHVRAEPGPSIMLAATRDDALPGAMLIADGVEQWGDLVLETTSRRATLPFWLHEVLAPWPPWLRSPGPVAAVVVLLNVLLLWACGLACRTRSRNAVRTRAARSTLSTGVNLRRMATGVIGLATVCGLLIVLSPTTRLTSLDLVAALPEARLDTSWPSLHAGISIQPVIFEHVRYPSIVAMPTSRIAWKLDVPKGAVFRGGAAMRPDVWLSNSDGVQMSVTVEHALGRTVMAHLTLFPLGVEAHRKLFPLEVPLHPWAGQRVTLVLETTPERWGNAVNDVPVWTSPRVEWPRREGTVVLAKATR